MATHVTLIEQPNANIGALTAFGRQFWSPHAYLLIMSAIDDMQPDVVWFQNTAHAIGPAGIQAASDMGVPVVAALRNERLLLGWGDALRGTYNGCRSRPRRWRLGNMFHVKHTWQRCVDVLVPVSEYVRGRFIAAGFDPEQLVAKPNVVYPEPRVEPREIRRQVLFVGRDIPTKGLHVLLEALDLLGRCCAASARGRRRRLCPRFADVQFLGPVPHARVLDLMAESMAVVVPSVWAEPFGRVAIEAQAVGTPAIVSDAGGLPETKTCGMAVPANDPTRACRRDQAP